MLFGRVTELEQGRAALARAREGAGSVLVLSGEPGIGKSALARAIADEAEATGARVAVGRAWEVGGAPALWPWSQALAELAIDLDALLGSAPIDGAAAQRVVAFDRVARALGELAEDRTLVLVLDDLHAADAASLELALVVARSLARRRILLIATTRESELRESPTHADLVAKVAREGVRLALRRLDETAVAAWLADARFEGDARDVLRLTEGNPLFVHEALRLGDRFAHAAAGGAAVVLQAHVARASDETRTLLAAAAVLGRDPARADVVALTGAAPDAVAAAEREGLRLGLLAPAAPGTWSFAHVLLRDALYDGLAVSAREALHARAAALLDARGASPGLTVLHVLAAANVLSPADVIHAVDRAARAAFAQHAEGAALGLLAEARACLVGRLDDASALALDLLAADARMRTSPGDEARALAAACAERAARLGRPVEQARAALIYGAELLSGQVDPRMVRLLEDALAVAPAADVALRARLLTRLASAMTPPSSDAVFEVLLARANEGVALARTTNDPDTLLYALRFAASAAGYAVDVKTRGALADEIVPLARALGDELTLVTVGAYRVAQLYEAGAPDVARAEAESYARLVERLPLPALQWRAVAQRASIAAYEARFDDARALGDDLRRVATETGARQGAVAWALLQISLTLSDGNRAALAAVEPELMATVAGIPPMAPWVACIHALLGRADAARAAVQPVLDLPRGFPWLISAGQVAALLESAELAERFYPLLQAEALGARFFWGPAGAFPIGPTSRVLGELARILGRDDEARAHLDEAVAQCRASRAVALLALSEAARARLDTPPRRVAAEARVGVPALAREGDVWVVRTPGRATFRVKHAKGLEYLSALVDAPGREQYVLALAGAGEAPEDAGALLDERAKAAYRHRVEELEDRLAEAERHDDAPRATRAREELDALAEQLAGALGLGGRDRKAASNVERARINVQRRIKDALRRIAEHDAELARYLDATVRTGTYCVFVPV